MLDLQNYKVKQYELKWFDGELVRLNMPSQNLLQRMVNIENIEGINEQLTEMKNLLRTMLNANTSGKTFDAKEINELPLDIVEAIFTDYMDYVNAQLGE